MKTLTPRCCALAFATFLAVASHAQELQRITITGSATPQAPGIAGFGSSSLQRAPFAATVIDQRALQDAGISSLGDITRLDAGITDAYNAPGYWNQLAVRGYTLDNRFNYRRDGLPVNAETVIGQANKQSLEVLKGTSGLQAGTSAPGGLVNLVVKRPTERVRAASLMWAQDGSLSAALDIGERSPDGLGWRINLDGARLDPPTRNSRGQRWLAAAALDARLGRRTLVQAEFELSRQSQPSTPGLSALGASLPDARDIDPRTNLVDKRITVANGPRSLALAEGSVWVLCETEGKVSRVDPKTNKVTATVDLGIPESGGDIVAGAGSIWVTAEGFPLSRIDPTIDKVVQQFHGEGGGALGFAADSLWLINLKQASVWRIDPKRVRATLAE